MGGIIELTDDGGHEVLTSTGSGGLLGGRYLEDDPLESYLTADETAKYVLRNKKSGVEIESEGGTEQLEADDDYQTLAMVTDLRILFVAGKSSGDQTVSLVLPQIVEARVESSGFRTSTLTLETLSDERWVFPCRGDPEPVASYIEEAAQIWANAGRLLDDIEAAISDARELLDTGEFRSAAEQIQGGHETIQTARERISELGVAASTQIAGRAKPLESQLVGLKREIQAASAGHAHVTAQDHWREREYREAARAYESAVDGYERALSIDGAEPSEETLTARLRGARNERELLRAGPLVDADTKRRHASALADPQAAASEWEEAHEGYRQLLQLEWPTDERAFVADRELVREQTAEIAEDAIGDHQEAGRQWLTSGDKLAVNGRHEQATQVYERANHQFEQANRLARELCPESVDAIETALEATARRLDGDTPTESVPEDPIAFDPDAEPDTDDEEPGTDDEEPTEPVVEGPEGVEGLSFHDSSSEQPDPTAGGEGTHSRRSASTPVRNDRSENSVLDRIQAQKQIDTESSEPATAETDVEYTESDETVEDLDTVVEGGLEAAVASLTRTQFAEVVAALWQAEGWMTTEFTATNDTVYDVVAIKNESDRRQLIWAENGDGDVAETLFKQCETTLESSQADTAVIVTADTVSEPAKQRAESHDLTLVGVEAFLERVDEAGLAPRLREMDAPERDESPHV